MNQETALFWDTIPSSLVDMYRRFRGTCCLSPDNERSVCLSMSLRWRIQRVFLERRYISTRLHEIIVQKTAFFKPP